MMADDEEREMVRRASVMPRNTLVFSCGMYQYFRISVVLALLARNSFF